MSRHLGLVLAGTLLATLGAMGCQEFPRLDHGKWTGNPSDRSGLRLFDDAAGTARVAIGWSDRRHEMRTVQAFSDAASFSAIVFTLSNAARFRQARAKAFLVGGQPGATVSDAFTSLPSDPVANYVLSAILFRNVATDSLSVPAYQDRDNVVGVGISAAFSLAPGENRRIPIIINALPALAVDTNSNYRVDRLTPTLVAGDAQAYTEMLMRESENPLADRLRVRFFENGAMTLLESREYIKPSSSPDPAPGSNHAPSSSPSQTSTLNDYARQPVLLGDSIFTPQSSDTVRLPLTLPQVPQGRVTLSTFMQVEMASGDIVLSRRGMGVIIEKGGKVDVSIDATPTPGPTVQPTSTLPPT